MLKKPFDEMINIGGGGQQMEEIMKFLKYAAAGSLLVLSLASGPVVSAAEIELKFQAADPAGSPQFLIRKEWASGIEEITGGRLSIELLAVGSVVDYSESQDAVAAGLIDGHMTDMSYWAGKDPAFSLLGNPVGAWSSPQEMYRFMEFGGGLELANEIMEPYGLHMIGAITPGLEAFVSNKPLDGVDDLKGLKMRAPEGLVQEVFAAAGAAPVNLPFSEVFTSLDKGVIDAADATVFSGNHDAGMHKVALHPVYPGFHSMPTIEVSMNKAKWDGLPDDLKRILELAVRDLAFIETSKLAMQDLEAVADARQSEGVVIHNWSAEERAKFRKIATGLWQKVASRSENAQKVYDTLTAYLTDQGLLATN